MSFFAVESALEAKMGFRAVTLVTGRKEILAPTWAQRHYYHASSSPLLSTYKENN